jgi:hypothetical protein
MRKEQVKKNPREDSMTPKQEDHTPKSLELSEGQLEVHFRRLNLAHTRRIYKEVADRAERKVGRIETSWLCCWPKKWHEGNRRGCNVVPGAHTSHSSRPSTSSTSRCSRHSGNP